MKNFSCLWLSLLLLSACGKGMTEKTTSKGFQMQDTYLYSFCGTISQDDSGYTGGSSDPQVKTDDGKIYFLLAEDSAVQKELIAIKNPNNYYLGCAYGDRVEQGYEGSYLIVKDLELLGTY